MTISDAQKRASAKYRKNNTKSVVTTFYPAEKDLYEWISKQTNKSGYIKELIRQDMQRDIS